MAGPTLDQSKFSAAFRNRPEFPAIAAEIQRSPTLVNEINRFPGKIVLGDAGSGGSYKRANASGPSEDDRITIESSWLTSQTQTPELTGRFATMLGHELGHAQRPGGYQQSNGAHNPNEATRLGLKGEGVAITAEYVVARELNRPMWSDYDGSLKNGMNALANQHGLNTPTFKQAAQTLGANTYATRTPSVAPQLKYNEYYAYNWVAAKGAPSAYGQVDWARVKGSSSGHPSITYSTNPTTKVTTITGALPRKGSTSTINFNAVVDANGQHVIPVPTAPAAEIDNLSTEKQTFLQQTRDAMNRLCEEKGYPNNQGRENMICALALAGMEKNMPGVDAAFVKDNNVTIAHNPQSLSFKIVTLDSTIAANTPAQQSMEAIAALVPETKQHEQDQQQIQQQMERQATSIGSR